MTMNDNTRTDRRPERCGHFTASVEYIRIMATSAADNFTSVEGLRNALREISMYATRTLNEDQTLRGW